MTLGSLSGRKDATSETTTTKDAPLGTLYGVSAGPGDPDLISVKGVRLIQASTHIAFPAGSRGDTGSAPSRHRPGIAQRIVSPWLLPHHVLLPLQFPYTQDATELTAAWTDAATVVVQVLTSQQDVVFVSEGDVAFYSTFAYLARYVTQLLPGVTVTAVPGVCSPLASAAALGLPLALGDQRLTVLPALYSVSGAVSDLETALETSDVLVLMKVGSVYEQVWRVLQQRQLLEASYVVEWATSDRQTIYHGLSDRPNLVLSYFSLMIIYVSPSQYGVPVPQEPQGASDQDDWSQ
ncbi:MAG: precorrin-2 C(20)-methyltransferase [Elainellaceae cyanobacterium]